MKYIIILTLIFLSGCASQQDKEQEANSLSLVNAWIESIDNLDADKAWEMASQITKERFEKETKTKYWLGIRKPMGDVIKRDLQLNWKLELFKGNIPDGTHREIVYWSKYENRVLARERFVVTLENGQWKLVEWYVK